MPPQLAPAWTPEDFEVAASLVEAKHGQYPQWQCRAGVCGCAALVQWFREQGAARAVDLARQPATESPPCERS